MSKELKYEEIKDGELVKFEEPGDFIEGVLTFHKRQQGKNGMAEVYEVKTKEGTRSFFAPQDLHKKLKDIPLGRIIRAEFRETKVTNTGNTMKLFKVGHTEATEANLNILGITIFKQEEEKEEDINADDIPI